LANEKQFVINADLIAIHQIIDSISYFSEHFKSKTSIYIGVCWDNNAKKWQAKLHHNKRLNYGGFFDKEEDAAMKVNLFCDKCGIERKNPMIDIELIEDHQVIHSLRILHAKK
jgi:hypothetical protein